jgi:hypothetical protein
LEATILNTKTISFFIKLLLLILSSVHDFLTDCPEKDKKPADSDIKPQA